MPYPDPSRTDQTWIPTWTPNHEFMWVVPFPLGADFPLNTYVTLPPELAADEPVYAPSPEPAHDASRPPAAG